MGISFFAFLFSCKLIGCLGHLIFPHQYKRLKPAVNQDYSGLLKSRGKKVSESYLVSGFISSMSVSGTRDLDSFFTVRSLARSKLPFCLMSLMEAPILTA